MKNKALIIAIAAVAAAIICVGAVIGVVLSRSDPAVQPESDTTLSVQESTEKQTLSDTLPVITQSASTDTTASSEEASQTKPSSTEAETDKTTKPTSAPSAAPSSTAPNKNFNEVFTLPKAPQYVPPDISIDFSEAKIASYKYNPDGNYYYTDDKECWQSNFGFNEVYDTFAPLTVMYYDTVRTTFEYGGKEWLIQTWKGQYGMAFVGGEVGIYTRPVGSIGSHYVCADKKDWLKMEMAFMWDENETGEYRAVFNRDYDDYWWATGFVVGFPNGSLRKTLTEFRLVTHITFKDTEMANAFCEAFEANGFRRVSKLNNNSPDTFVQVGPDVAFVWQNINHK